MFDWKRSPLRGLHLCSALVVGLFLIVHIGNHIAGLLSQQAHIDYMEVARGYYRNRLVEPILLLLVLWQALSGLSMVVRGWKARRGRVAWLQAVSGLYLAFFLLNHVAAVLTGRFWLGLDTDFRFAAAGFFVPPWQLFFAPYYFLGLWCLFIHVGCAVYWHLDGNRQRLRTASLIGFLAIGALIALLVVLSLASVLHPVNIPDIYRATYRP